MENQTVSNGAAILGVYVRTLYKGEYVTVGEPEPHDQSAYPTGSVAMNLASQRKGEIKS